MASVMAVMKQKNIRQAEKSLKDLLDKADNNANGKVELSDFLKILEAHGVEIEEAEMSSLKEMSNNKGEISKNDLLVHVKNSKIWKGFLESKTKNNTSGSNVAKVEDRTKVVKTAFKMLDLDKDGFITKEEFIQASKTLDKKQIERVYERFDVNKDGRLSKEEFQKLMSKYSNN